MRFISASVLYALLVVVTAVEAKTENEDDGTFFPAISLNPDLTLQVDGRESPLYVQNDGFIRFHLDIPDLGEQFFSRHHLQINVPYFSRGFRKNHYIEVSGNGSIPVSIPSEEPAGTPIYLYNGERRLIKSTAERVITPIAQFFIVYEMLNIVGKYDGVPFYTPSIDFKHGGFLEGVQGYALLDSSLRFARDVTEHLEVYYQMNPGGSSMTVVLLFATGAVILNEIPIDLEHFDALAMQKSFIYSAMAGKILDVSDEWVITPKISENLFHSHGSVRNFKSKLASQMVRGPVLAGGLSALDFFEKDEEKAMLPANWLITKKLMIKSASETRLLNEMCSNTIEGAHGWLADWGLNGATLAITGIGGSPDSLHEVFANEFQLQLGSRTHQQIKEFRDKQIKPLMENGPELYLIANQVFFDFMIGGLIYLTASEMDVRMGGTGMVSRRLGRGAGLSYTLRTLGGGAIEYLGSSVSDFVYDYVVKDSPMLAPLFRKDYLVEIDHGITPPEPGTEQPGPRQPHASHDEL